MTTLFKVTYTCAKSLKKRKVCQDGYLRIRESPFQVCLLNDAEKIIFLSKDKLKFESTWNCTDYPVEVLIGSYWVIIEEPISDIDTDTDTKRVLQEHTAVELDESHKYKKFASTIANTSANTGTSDCADMNAATDNLPFDKMILNSMLLHQIEAAKFLINALHPPAENQSSLCNYKLDNTIQTEKHGAILGDNMGLGQL